MEWEKISENPNFTGYKAIITRDSPDNPVIACVIQVEGSWFWRVSTFGKRDKEKTGFVSSEKEAKDKCYSETFGI